MREVRENGGEVREVRADGGEVQEVREVTGSGVVGAWGEEARADGG